MEDNNRIEQSKVQQNKIECKIECNIIEQGKALENRRCQMKQNRLIQQKIRIEQNSGIQQTGTDNKSGENREIEYNKEKKRITNGEEFCTIELK